MSKLPAFQFYPGDWRKDPGIQSLTLEQRGAWLEIMCLMHESEPRGYLMLNGKPFPEASLARLLGMPECDLLNQNSTTTVNHLLNLLVERGVASRDAATGALYSRRMVRDEELRQTRASCGKMGGNPALIKQNQTTGLNQNPTPSVSLSISSSDITNPSSLQLEVTEVITVERIYEEYPRKAGKPKALKAISRAAARCASMAVSRGFPNAMAYLLDRTLNYSRATTKWKEDDRQYIPWPQKWFNEDRFNDDPNTWERTYSSGANGNRRMTFA